MSKVTITSPSATKHLGLLHFLAKINKSLPFLVGSQTALPFLTPCLQKAPPSLNVWIMGKDYLYLIKIKIKIKMSKKVKSYWDEIKNQEVYFYGGSQGWEVKLGWVERRKWDRKTGEYIQTKQLVLQFPFGYGDGVKASEKAQTRREVNFQKKKRKLLAQASRNREEYYDLNSRIDRISEEEFNNILKSGMRGFNLGQYIRERHLTDGEAYALFWRM